MKTKYVLKHRQTKAFVAPSTMAVPLSWIPDERDAEQFDSATQAAIAALNLRVGHDVTIEPVTAT